MEIIKIKLTKHQIKQLEPLQAIITAWSLNNTPGSIVAQIFPIEGYLKVGTYNQKQILALHAAFEEIKQ